MASTASNKGPVFLLCLLLPAMASAGDWKFSSGVSLSERYSDNAQLSPTGREQDDWITEVTPRFGVHREGARLKVNADYSLQGLLYANGTGTDKLRHNLDGRANAELVEEWFYLDGAARISHELNNLGGGVGLGDSVGIGNTTSVGSYSISPYMKHRFGSVATVEARVGHDGVFIGDSSYTDTNITRYALNATSGNHFFPLSWGFNYDRADSSNSNSAVADTGSERANANARYQLSRHFGLLGQAGMEKNDFPGAANAVKDYSFYGLGVYYSAGRRLSLDVLYNHSDNGNFLSGSVTANPTLRTTLKASVGERSYGRSYSLNLSHNTRHSNWSLRYQDDLTSYRQEYLLNLGTKDVYLCTDGIKFSLPGGASPDPATCVFLGSGNIKLPFPIDQTYVSKGLFGAVSYSLRRNTWALSLYSNNRQLQGTLGGGGDTTSGVQASWAYKAANRTTYTLTTGLSQVESNGTTLGSRSDDLWNIGLVASHQFRNKLSGSLEVRHQERQSDQVNGDYAENSVAARVNMTF